MQIFEIEGCFPNMPKETIRFALRDIVQRIRREENQDGVYVPRYSDKQPCAWKSKRKKMQKIPFEVMLDVMEFSLDCAMVRMPDGRIMRQREGIPMGDPLSPGTKVSTSEKRAPAKAGRTPKHLSVISAFSFSVYNV